MTARQWHLPRWLMVLAFVYFGCGLGVGFAMSVLFALSKYPIVSLLFLPGCVGSPVALYWVWEALGYAD